MIQLTGREDMMCLQDEEQVISSILEIRAGDGVGSPVLTPRETTETRDSSLILASELRGNNNYSPNPNHSALPSAQKAFDF
jgi:hypothetical protein